MTFWFTLLSALLPARPTITTSAQAPKELTGHRSEELASVNLKGKLAYKWQDWKRMGVSVSPPFFCGPGNGSWTSLVCPGMPEAKVNWSFQTILPFGTSGKESSCLWRTYKRREFDRWVRKILCSRKWQPAPVFLAWGIPWTEEPGGLQSMGSQRVGHD